MKMGQPEQETRDRFVGVRVEPCALNKKGLNILRGSNLSFLWGPGGKEERGHFRGRNSPTTLKPEGEKAG